LWIPKWLGEVYTKLYLEFDSEVFTFNDAVKIIGKSVEWVNVAFSKLHKYRLLYIHEKSKIRLYRIVKPETFTLILSGKIKNIDRIKQERYIQLICDASLNLMRNYNLTSICLYGSVARGTARPDSDIDLLVISDDFKGTLTSRIECILNDVEDKISDEIERLKRFGVNTELNIYPLRREEVSRLPPILLDLTEDGIIIYDNELFLEKILTRLKAKLIELNAKRIFIDRDTWYWDLKPDYKFGEVIEF